MSVLALASPCGSEPLLANFDQSRFSHSAAGVASHRGLGMQRIFERSR
jgi:hypothetical protein